MACAITSPTLTPPCGFHPSSIAWLTLLSNSCTVNALNIWYCIGCISGKYNGLWQRKITFNKYDICRLQKIDNALPFLN